MPIKSKEFEFLCACAGVEIAPQRVAQIACAINAELDWNEFLRLGEHHGVLPLVERTLNQEGVSPPSGVQRSLQEAHNENIRRNLWFAGELGRILQHFEKRNLRAIPYKGPVLAESAYGDLTLRNFADLDLLISPADVEAAQQALAELDYRPSERWTPAIDRFWRRKGYERAFDGVAGRYLVELQWRLLPYFYAVDLRNDDLLIRCRRGPLSGREVPCLSPEDSLVVLCLHAAKHLWMRLIWVCDLAESMRTQPIDYSLVVERAREFGILRMIGVSLWLAANLVGADLAPEARKLVTGDAEVAGLGEIFAERLARGDSYDFESPEYFLLIGKLRERRLDRWRYFWRLVWTPGVGDLAAVRLPEVLFPLYRGIRLARLMRKLIRRPLP